MRFEYGQKLLLLFICSSLSLPTYWLMYGEFMCKKTHCLVNDRQIVSILICALSIVHSRIRMSFSSYSAHFFPSTFLILRKNFLLIRFFSLCYNDNGCFFFAHIILPSLINFHRLLKLFRSTVTKWRV